ncbi:hypothetical protein C8F01DRAFT_1138353 [Mycena amicta]|nr:hypothetical protein C8F01DRAFT_1138353 [Mycena amicta]
MAPGMDNYDSAEDDPQKDLTAVERRKRTRRVNQAQERADERAIIESTAGVMRQSKKDALTKKVWETESHKKDARKRSGSTKESSQPKKVKQGLGAMLEAQPVPTGTKARAAPLKPGPSKPAPSKPKPSKSKSKDAEAPKRQFAPASLDSTEDDEPPPKKALAKPQRLVLSDDECSDELPEQGSEHHDDEQPAEDDSEAEEEEEEDLEIGEEELAREKPTIIKRRRHVAVDEDVDMPSSRNASPTRSSSRASRASSGRGSEFEVPADTEAEDLFNNAEDNEDDEDDPQPHRRSSHSAAGDSGHALTSDDDGNNPVPSRQRKSAQQAKYDAEVLAVHKRKAPPSKPTKRQRKAGAGDQSEWDRTIRLVTPPSGVGQLRLGDQTARMQTLIRKTIALVAVDVTFECAYPAIPDRGAYVATFLYDAARQLTALTSDVKRALKNRIKTDDNFCRLLADLVLARVSILRNQVKSSMTTKVAGYLQLGAAGVKPVHVRSRISAARRDQAYIFPILFQAAIRTEPDVGDAGESDDPEPPAMKFKTDLPFHAPPIIEVLQQVFFSKKGIGRKYQDRFKSYNAKYPNELELPSSMLALAAVHLASAIDMWQTGREVGGSEFSQGTLETTYNRLVDFIADTRAHSPDGMHRTMHALYKAVTYVLCIHGGCYLIHLQAFYPSFRYRRPRRSQQYPDTCT